jgi:hypothetical protein
VLVVKGRGGLTLLALLPLPPPVPISKGIYLPRSRPFGRVEEDSSGMLLLDLQILPEHGSYLEGGWLGVGKVGGHDAGMQG